MKIFAVVIALEMKIYCSAPISISYLEYAPTLTSESHTILSTHVLSSKLQEGIKTILFGMQRTKSALLNKGYLIAH